MATFNGKRVTRHGNVYYPEFGRRVPKPKKATNKRLRPTMDDDDEYSYSYLTDEAPAKGIRRPKADDWID